jgi:hypothetical protein
MLTEEERKCINDSADNVNIRISDVKEQIEIEKKEQEKEQQERLERLNALKETAESFKKQNEQFSENMSNAFENLKTAMNEMFDEEDKVEDAIKPWYNAIDGYNMNFNKDFFCVNVLCDRLEKYGEPEYFGYLFDCAKSWASEPVKNSFEYKNFYELSDCDDNDKVKLRTIALLRKMDYSSVERFTVMCVSNGMNFKVVEFE